MKVEAGRITRIATFIANLKFSMVIIIPPLPTYDRSLRLVPELPFGHLLSYCMGICRPWDEVVPLEIKSFVWTT